MESLNFRGSPTRRVALKAAGGAGLAAILAACTSKSPAPGGTTVAPTISTPVTSAPVTSASVTSTPGLPSTRQWSALSTKLSRPLLRPGAARFTAAAQLYNPRFDSAPAPSAIAQCTTPADVSACVAFAAESAVPIAVRSGGHSYGGWSRGRGLVLDLRALSTVTVDRSASLVQIGAGALLVDVYAALAAQNVAIAAGSCPTVGLSGLALGGGVGVLSRAFGLTCDAIRSLQIVTADGRVRVVDAGHDPDLFWALRGGGGSFGAVTQLTLAVRPAPTITTFFLQFNFAQAAEVLTAWQRWIVGTSISLWSTCKLLADPGDGQLNVTVSGTWIGTPSALDAQLAPLLVGLPAPTSKYANTSGYRAAMLGEAGCAGESAASCTAQALRAPKRQPFAATSSLLMKSLPADGVAAAVATTMAALNMTGLVEGGISFDSLGGAVAAVKPAATAFPYRNAIADIQYTATWGATAPAGPTAAAPFDRFVRGFRRTMTPWLGSAAYVNYADASIADYGPAYWGANYPRLQQVKAQYDPGDLFTWAQSVRA